MVERHFHRELHDVERMTATLGGMVEHAIGKALVCLKEGNEQMAAEVLRDEVKIDELEVEIEERCLKLLALYQPVARDLRLIITMLKVTGELESMGDLAESIARKCYTTSPSHIAESKMDLMDMGRKTVTMAKLALDSMLQADSSLARRVIALDDEIDQLHAKHHALLAEALDRREIHHIKSQLTLLSVSRSLERLADMATNIAEDVIYLVEAHIARHREFYQARSFDE